MQNLLPCKSAAGVAAAAVVRGRMLPDGGTHPGSGALGNAVLYEDLPDPISVPHSHLHNHLHAGHVGQPTIEVRATNLDERQRRLEHQRLPLLSSRQASPAPHHLDYLDYRDPRSILRVADKPSRAVLGGYRTPRALLAKSQGVPHSIASCAPADSASSVLESNHSLLACQNALIARQQHPTGAAFHCTNNPQIYLDFADTGNTAIHVYPRASSLSITPTHRPRLGTPTPAEGIAFSPPPSPASSLVIRSVRGIASRRPSVDLEGYSYIDFKEPDFTRSRSSVSKSRDRASQRLLSATPRSNSIDSDGYSYIDLGYKRIPGSARRIVADGTEDEVCPLCTIQQIQNLLARPEEVYLDLHDT